MFHKKKKNGVIIWLSAVIIATLAFVILSLPKQTRIFPFSEKEPSSNLIAQITEAIELNDLKICDSIGNSVASEECKNAVVRSQALEAKTAALCNSLNKFEAKNCRAEVYFSRALSENDQSLCDYIEIATTKYRCHLTLSELK